MSQAICQTYETPYGTICYQVYRADEQKPWLAFLPGLTADHTLFFKQVEGLYPKYNCLTWDPPAHGLSRPFALRFTMADMAGYLRGILQKEGIEMPVLIGQSMGGYVSQVYMELYPNQVSGFVSIDSCSLKRKYYAAWELALLKHTKWMYLAFPWRLLVWCGTNGTAKSVYGRQVMQATMRSYQKREYCELADHGFRILANTVAADGAYNITCPALLLCGEKDQAGSAKRYNRAWAKQDGLKLVWLKGAGHNANTDAPDAVNQLIDAFVSSIHK